MHTTPSFPLTHQPMIPKSDFLLIGAGTMTSKGSMNTANFGKTSLFDEQDYEQQTSTWVLESRNDLRSVFVGHIHFKKLTKFRKFIEIFHCCMTRLRNTNLGVFIQCQYTRTILRNKNMGQSLFKKHHQTQEFEFWIIVVCIDMWKLLNQRKFLDRVFLRII